jgi:hypothetical protein
MTTKNNRSKNDCPPGAIPPFCRNNYFTGKLLTERDFTAEQRYLVDKLRLHHVALHGWGVVCGLKVTPHPKLPSLRLVVEPGLAIDGWGREIRVPESIDYELPSLQPSEAAGDHWATDSTSSDQPDPDPDLSQQPAGDPVTVTLYIYLRYVEQEAELMATPFAEYGTAGNARKPNRICESYQLEIAMEEPASFERIRQEMGRDDAVNSNGIYRDLLEESTELTDIDCIPLAVIRGFAPGQDLNAEWIDNDSYRRLLPSTATLHLLIRSILKRMPTTTLTRIADIGWTHRKEYSYHEFLRLYIGEQGSSPGFEITFDGPVRPEGISARTFQAIAVHYPEKLDGAGQPEVVPAKVRLNHDHTKAHLHIDPHYAKNRLSQARFDLYLLLRCNLVVDKRGVPVDGELSAQLDSDRGYVPAVFPTGDGFPGGLFESWIRVHGDTH